MVDTLERVDPDFRDVDFGSLTVTDSLERMNELRSTGQRVVPVRWHEETAWLVLDYDGVAEGFMNEAHLPAAAWYNRYTTEWLGRVVPSMRGAEHRAHRAMFGNPFLPARIRQAADRAIVPNVHDLIDRFDANSADLVSQFCAPLPFRVITGMLGLPAADNDEILENLHALFRFPWDPEGSREAKGKMAEYLRPYIESRRADPGDDIISFLATAEIDGECLDDDTLADFVRFLWPAAGENTQHGIALTLYRGLSDPTLWERLKACPEDRAAHIEEVLRLEPPVTSITRFTEHPVTIAGVDIPAGSTVLLGIGAANRDPAKFDSPDEISFDRGVPQHISFGRGPHFCLGAHLARAEIRASLDAMIARLPGLRLVDADSVFMQGGMQRGPVSLVVAYDEVLPSVMTDG